MLGWELKLGRESGSRSRVGKGKVTLPCVQHLSTTNKHSWTSRRVVDEDTLTIATVEKNTHPWEGQSGIGENEGENEDPEDWEYGSDYSDRSCLIRWLIRWWMLLLFDI